MRYLRFLPIWSNSLYAAYTPNGNPTAKKIISTWASPKLLIGTLTTPPLSHAYMKVKTATLAHVISQIAPISKATFLNFMLVFLVPPPNAEYQDNG